MNNPAPSVAALAASPSIARSVGKPPAFGAACAGAGAATVGRTVMSVGTGGMTRVGIGVGIGIDVGTGAVVGSGGIVENGG